MSTTLDPLVASDSRMMLPYFHFLGTIQMTGGGRESRSSERVTSFKNADGELCWADVVLLDVVVDLVVESVVDGVGAVVDFGVWLDDAVVVEVVLTAVEEKTLGICAVGSAGIGIIG